MGGAGRRWLVAGFVLLSSATARAGDSKTPFPPCTTTPTEADRKAAQGAFAAGHGSFNEADYSTAITYWRDAYRRDCTAHLMLLNLARAYELRGERNEAVNALQTYLDRKPDAPDADQIRRRIENMKAQIAEAAPPAAPAPAPAAPTPFLAPDPVQPAPPAADSSADTARSRNVLPLVVAGAGGVVAIVGVIVFAGGAGKISDAEQACPGRKNCLPAITETGNQGRRQEQAGAIVLAGGAALAAGGLIWYFVSGAPTHTAGTSAFSVGRAKVSPAASPGYAGLTLAGSF